MVSTIHEVNQWGRKDPFTPTSATRNVEVQIYKADGTAITKGTNGVGGEFKNEVRTTTTQTTINHLIQNPSTHYAQGERYKTVPIACTEGYNNTNKEGDWWNPTIKTIYDPCPNGYRIPKSGTYGLGHQVETHPDWSDWSEGGLKSGRTFKNTSFFSTSGNRSSCQFVAVGYSVYHWMSTPSSTIHGYNMNFSSSIIIPNNTGHVRSFGFTTRCIKE